MSLKFCAAWPVLLLFGVAGCTPEDHSNEWEQARDYEAVRAIDMEQTNSIPMSERITLQQRNEKLRTNQNGAR